MLVAQVCDSGLGISVGTRSSQPLPDAEVDADTGMECVICMSEPRDTLIVPCRHLCLCASCAASLRSALFILYCTYRIIYS